MNSYDKINISRYKSVNSYHKTTIKSFISQMKHLYITISLLFFTITAYSQSNGSIVGTILDDKTKQGLPSTLQLLNPSDSSLVTGTVADIDGSYQLKNIRTGNYLLKISSIGYATLYKEGIMIKENQMSLIGILYLMPNKTDLEGVIVTDKKLLFEVDGDKKVYHVSEDAISEGGTAIEILQNVPSVEVDIDGKVSLRGTSKIKILIDGRPTKFSGGINSKSELLRQLPADAIDRIEIINNPSSKYDGDGNGIINIVLKKNVRLGWNGLVSAFIATHDKYGAAGQVGIRNSKINTFIAGSLRNTSLYNSGITTRESYDETNNKLTSNNILAGNTNTKTPSLRVGFEYFPTSNSAIGLLANYSQTKNYKTREWDYKRRNIEDDLRTQTLRNNNSTNLDNDFTFAAYYQQLIKKHSQKVSINAGYSQTNSVDTTYIRHQTMYSDYLPITTLADSSLRPVTGYEKNLSAQIDYEIKPTKKIYIEAGAKYTNKITEDDNQFYDFARGNQEWFSNDLRTNTFQLQTKIPALYSSFRYKFTKQWIAQVGLRAENTQQTGKLLLSDSTFTTQYLSLLPSAMLIFKLNKTNDFRLNYSKRINRPSGSELNPFNDYTNVNFYKTGNPYLLPEYVHSVELTYGKEWEKHSLLASTYYKFLDNEISRITTIDTLADFTKISYTNARQRKNYGIECVVRNSFNKKITLTSTINAFYTQITSSDIAANISNSGFGSTFRSQVQYRITPTTNFQFIANYTAPRILLQGTQKGFFSFSTGVRQSFFDKRLLVNLSVQDIFNTLQTRANTYIEAPYLKQYSQRKQETQIITLSVSYRFHQKIKINTPETKYDKEDIDNNDAPPPPDSDK